jgi:NHLM bacteriocin system ABC transporter peptidase/ATP-binding protein
MTTTTAPAGPAGPQTSLPRRPLAVKTGRRVEVPTVLQMEVADCGAASLGMILALHGRWVTLDELRTACGVSRDGVSAVDIIGGAEAYGLDCRGARVGISDMAGMAMPVIAWWDNNHFLVLEGIDGRNAHINDPARGRRTLSVDEFDRHFSGVVLKLKPTDDFVRGGQRPSLLASIGSQVRSSRSGLVLATLAGALASVPTLAVALLSRLFVDQVLGRADRGLAWWIVASILLALVAQTVLVQLQYRVLSAVQHKLAIVGTVDLLDRMIRMPLSAYFRRSPGDFASRMTSPASLSQTLSLHLGGVLVGSVSFVIYAASLLLLDWRLGLLVVVPSILGLVVLRNSMLRQRTSQEMMLQAQGATLGNAVQALAAIETVKASGAVGEAFVGWVGRQVAVIDAQRKLARVSSVVGAVPAMLTALTALLVLVGGALLIDAGQLTLGGLLAFQFVSAALTAPVQQVLSSAAAVQQGLAQLGRIEDITEQPQDPRFDLDADGPPRERGPFRGAVELVDITFGYRSTGRPLLKSVSLDIEPGRWVALVGVSGAGKSTIARIAAGTLGPWSGRVLFDGRPLDQWDHVSLAAGLATVEQHVTLFEATVRDNVTLWDDTLDDERVGRALADAQILDAVMARSGGLDAAVLDAGRNFSGGQRQRIGLARALVRDPRLLVLDEATSALDPITEVTVMDAVRARGCAVLVVAHRLSTVRDADEIICLGRGGAVIERGTHASLLAADGWYAQSVRASGDGGVGD